MRLALLALSLAVACSKPHKGVTGEAPGAGELPPLNDCLLTGTCEDPTNTTNCEEDPTKPECKEQEDDDNAGSGGGDNTSNSGSEILGTLISRTPIEYKVMSGSRAYARVKIYFSKNSDNSTFSLEIAFTALDDLTVKRHSSKYRGDVSKHCEDSEIKKTNNGYYCYKYHKLMVKLTSGSTVGSHANSSYLGTATNNIGMNGEYIIPINKNMVNANSFRLKFNVPIADLNDGSLKDSFGLTTWTPHFKVWRQFTASGGEKIKTALEP